MYSKLNKLKIIVFVMAISLSLNTVQFIQSDSPAQIKQELRSVKSWLKARKSPQTPPEINNLKLYLNKEGRFTSASAHALIPLLQKYSAVGELLELPKKLNLDQHVLNKSQECSSKLGLSENLYDIKMTSLEKNPALIFINGLPDIQGIQTTLISSGFGCKLLQKTSWRLSSGRFFYSRSSQLKIQEKNLPAHFAKFEESLVILDRFTNIYLVNQRLSPGELLNKGKILEVSEKDTDFNGGVKSVAINGKLIAFTIARTDHSCPRLELYTGYLSEILGGSMNSVKLVWKQSKCLLNKDTTNLNAYGGRVLFLNDQEILLSIGNPEIWTGSEKTKPRDDIGIIAKINLSNQKFNLISRGHRNPQGICFIEGSIFASEQGPDGGDEINKITTGKNYGWPYESYGWPYDKSPTTRTINSAFMQNTKNLF